MLRILGRKAGGEKKNEKTEHKKQKQKNKKTKLKENFSAAVSLFTAVASPSTAGRVALRRPHPLRCPPGGGAWSWSAPVVLASASRG